MKKIGLLIAAAGVFTLLAVGPAAAAPANDKKPAIQKQTKQTTKTPLGYTRTLKKERRHLPEWGNG
jgi:hypothetical protein